MVEQRVNALGRLPTAAGPDLTTRGAVPSGSPSIGRQGAAVRFALLCSTTTLAVWQANCVEELLRVGGNCVGVLLAPPAAPCGRVGPRRHAWAVLDRAARRGCLQLRRRDLWTLLPDLRPSAGASAWGESGQVVGEANGEVDFVLHLDGGEVPDELPWRSGCGVWSFDHDGVGGLDPSVGFWELRYGRSVCRTALRRNGNGGPGRLLFAGAAPTTLRSIARTRDDLLRASNDWAVSSVRALAAGVTEWQPRVEAAPPASAAPALSHILGYLVRLTWRRTMGGVLSSGTVQRWNVGIVDAPVHHLLDGATRPSPQWLPKPRRGRFLADPFPISRATGPLQAPPPTGVLDLLAEEYDYATRIGKIVRLQVPPRGAPTRQVLDLGCGLHVSYPFTLTLDGATYCLPECHRSQGVPVWKLSHGGQDWQQVGLMLPGHALVEPTVFEFGSRWWLFACDQNRSPHVKLYAWYAESPFGPWQSHALNPIKSDVRSSRPAGAPFLHGGRLYRPAQDCSRTYGGAVVINEVLELDVDKFLETVVTFVKPYPGPYSDGLHTVNPTPDGRTVIDGRKDVFSAREACRRIWRKIRAHLERLARHR